MSTDKYVCSDVNMRFQDFEVLRGERIEVTQASDYIVSPEEKSSSTQLHDLPLLSVLMMTFNHENYIAKAIEGVVKQMCEFPFELIIGEDCSTDNTRQICFDYQKRYPELIRVVYSKNNVGARPNLDRIQAACRGEYIAFCEGDDSWLDRRKLEKQVEILRKNPTVSLIYSNMIVRDLHGNDREEVSEFGGEGNRVISGDLFLEKVCLGVHAPIPMLSAVWRADKFREAVSKHPIFKWCLRQGDVTRFLGLATTGDVYIIDENLVLRNENPFSLMHTIPYQVYRDGAISRLYFSYTIPSLFPYEKRLKAAVLQRRLENAFFFSYTQRMNEFFRIAYVSLKNKIPPTFYSTLLRLLLIVGAKANTIKMALYLSSKQSSWSKLQFLFARGMYKLRFARSKKDTSIQ